ncbi:MAG: BspA family leucine-rich repeat surface protein, partial [Bacteroidales bacterium]|nr:BspA family leucine-rich repeat surface protein [Bacteroidales bacterium]
MKKKLFTSLILILLSFATFAQGEKEPYVVVKGNTATFYYNQNKPEDAYPIPQSQMDESWYHVSGIYAYDERNDITKVVFDQSFKEYKPNSCAYWLCWFSDLSEIIGMKENLNTERVTNMEHMFDGCSNLKTLDLSGFNTANVVNMTYMFWRCRKLKSIFVSDGWTTSSVSFSESMFSDCSKLYGGKGSSPKSLDMYEATYAKIDGGESDPGYLTKFGESAYVHLEPYAVVSNGSATFYFNDDSPDNALPIRTSDDDSEWPLSLCTKINKVVIDKSFKDYKPERTSCWFWGFENLVDIDGLKYLNTENLEYMNEMFQFCDNLKSVDLSGFNTAKVTDMTRLFWGCNNLESIFVGDGWNISLVTKSSGMFEDCFKLYGGKGTAYNADKTDATYAKIDGGESAPGYLTKSGEPAFKKIVSIEITTMPKTDYLEGENFSDANGVITLTYHNGDKGKINLSDATISGFDKTKIGEQTLKVEYNGLETTLTVTVTTPTPVSDISDKESGIKVWSANSSIFIESAPDAKYKIIDL